MKIALYKQKQFSAASPGQYHPTSIISMQSGNYSIDPDPQTEIRT